MRRTSSLCRSLCSAARLLPVACALCMLGSCGSSHGSDTKRVRASVTDPCTIAFSVGGSPLASGAILDINGGLQFVATATPGTGLTIADVTAALPDFAAIPAASGTPSATIVATAADFASGAPCTAYTLSADATIDETGATCSADVTFSLRSTPEISVTPSLAGGNFCPSDSRFYSFKCTDKFTPPDLTATSFGSLASTSAVSLGPKMPPATYKLDFGYPTPSTFTPSSVTATCAHRKCDDGTDSGPLTSKTFGFNVKPTPSMTCEIALGCGSAGRVYASASLKNTGATSGGTAAISLTGCGVGENSGFISIPSPGTSTFATAGGTRSGTASPGCSVTCYVGSNDTCFAGASTSVTYPGGC